MKNGASGLLIYRLISVQSQRLYWIQSSCRMFYKNGKPESIGMTHRLLTLVYNLSCFPQNASVAVLKLYYKACFVDHLHIFQ